MGCDRGFNDDELPHLERYVRPRLDLLSKRSGSSFRIAQVKRRIERAPQELIDLKNELAQWDHQLASLKRLIPIEVNYTKLLKEDIPAAERAHQAQEDKLDPAKAKVQDVCICAPTRARA